MKGKFLFCCEAKQGKQRYEHRLWHARPECECLQQKKAAPADEPAEPGQKGGAERRAKCENQGAAPRRRGWGWGFPPQTAGSLVLARFPYSSFEYPGAKFLTRHMPSLPPAAGSLVQRARQPALPP